MTQADEKELVLGNKQLISLFFVVAALCGVFFAMGYMIGRNSAKATLAQDATQGGAAPVPRQQPEPPRETAAAPEQDATTPAAPLDASAAAVDTRPAQDTQAAPPPPARDTAKDAKTNVKTPPNAIEVAVPEAGTTYLQVTALPRTDADNMVRTLREQSFPVIIAESSKNGLYRVLVGPYRQTAAVADAKNRLRTLGFANAFVQKQ